MDFELLSFGFGSSVLFGLIVAPVLVALRILRMSVE